MAASKEVVLPKEVYGRGLTWKVRRRRGLRRGGEHLYGLCNPAKQEILINTSICNTVDRARRTLIHETIHSLLEAHPQYYDEKLVVLLEDTVDELIRLNPAILSMYGYEQHGGPQ